MSKNIDDEINDGINRATQMIDRYCNSSTGKAKNGLAGFGEGILALVGVSGMTPIPGEDALALLNKGSSLSMAMNQQLTMATLQLEAQALQDVLPLLQASQELDQTQIMGLNQAIQSCQQLTQIEILGAYLFLFMILTYVLLT